jgi:excisionase family DNA binding protein
MKAEDSPSSLLNTDMDLPPTSVMTLEQAAAYLQVSKAHLSNVIGGKVRGIEPVRCFRLGRRILIKREWIDEWLERGHEGGLK